MQRPPFFLFLTGAATALVWLAYIAAGSDPVLGAHDAFAVLYATALGLTGLFAVMLSGRLIIAVALGDDRSGPTGFQRVTIHAVLTFVSAFVVLRSLGFDTKAVLATSAILTAAVGFAMQAMFGSVIGGFALHLDRLLKVGQVFYLDGQELTVTSLNWRTVAARRTDGRVLVLPNTRLSDSELLLAPPEGVTRVELRTAAPVSTSPQQVSAVLTEVIGDFEMVDGTRPVLVTPAEYQPRTGTMIYRMRFWMEVDCDGELVEGEIMRRAWYAFQRHRIPWPMDERCQVAQDPWSDPDILRPLVAAALPDVAARGDVALRTLAAATRLLLYGPDEPLIVPEDCAGRALFLAAGTAEDCSSVRAVHGCLAVERPSAAARVRRLGNELATYIGPYAARAIDRAAASAQDPAALRRLLAREIDDPGDRDRFLAGADGQTGEGAGNRNRIVRGPLTAQRVATGVLWCGDTARAVDEVAILAIDVGALEAARQQRPGIAAI